VTSTLKLRIIVLQVIVTIVFAFGAWFAFWAAGFTHSQVHDQLSQQKIAMPLKATLSPKEYSQADINALAPYSGTQLDNGAKAEAYANHYIGVHLAAMGMTYSEVSAKYMNLTTFKHLPATNPQVQAVDGLRNTIFMGTMLRGSLLQAYAWWQVGDYALYAGIVMTIGAAFVLFALLFELLFAPRALNEQSARPGFVTSAKTA
jgi:hypothetical protein